MRKDGCYIAGPMTGLPDMNIPAFRLAAGILRARGFRVVSPVELGDFAFDNSVDAVSPEEYLRLDLEMLVRSCSRICVLDGWERSIGARAEVAVAITLGFPFYAISEDDEVRPIPQPREVLITHGYHTPVHLRLRQEDAHVAHR